MIESLHPALPLFVAAAAVPLLGVKLRPLAAVVAGAVSLAMVLALPAGTGAPVAVAGLVLQPLQVDALGRLFAVAFALYAVIASLFAWSDESPVARAASLGLAGGALVLVLAGDLLTLFAGWELLAICSTFLIWAGRREQSVAAGLRYALFHVAGGMCLLAGILAHLHAGGANSLAAVSLQDLPGWLMLIGVAVNAAIPPLHAWLPDAYPRASIFGTVFLAAFTTKSAVYVLARLFPGAELLVWLGAAMALYGVVFAVLENDIRRLLGYHIISQVGYMVCAVGIGTELALNGASAHAFSHIFYKGLLMMSAGAVIWATGRGKLTELGGLARPLRWVLVLCMIGAFSISGVPLFNGFVSKSMVVSAAAEAHRAPIELMLLVASMGTFLHTGLKLPWFTFFGNAGETPAVRPVPRSMLLAMWIAAAVCIITGLWPALLYGALPFVAKYHPYTLDHVVTALELLVGTALGFWLLRGVLGGQPTVTLDVDRLYRRPLAVAVHRAGWIAQAAFQGAEELLAAAGRAVRARHALLLRAPPTVLGHHVAAVALVVAGLWVLWLVLRT